MKDHYDLTPGARYTVVERNHELDYLVIRDVGQHDREPTITDDAEKVVRRLWNSGELKASTRLFYYDSEGQLDEIRWSAEWGGAAFLGFRAYPWANNDHAKLREGLAL